MPNIDDTGKQVLSKWISDNRWAMAAVACLLFCAISAMLIGVIDTWEALLLVFAFGIAAFACSLKIKNTSKTEKLSVVDAVEAPDKDVLAKSLPNGTFLYGQDGCSLTRNTFSAFTMSSADNKVIAIKPIRMDTTETPYAFSDDVMPYASTLLAARRMALPISARMLPDKGVMGLVSISFEGDDPYAETRPVTRRAVQATDDAAKKIIIDKKRVTKRTVFDGKNMFLSEEGELLSIEDTQNANEIDIQTLIITSDGKIMVSRGTTEHPLYPGKAVPACSCSLLPTEKGDGTLQGAIAESVANKMRVLYGKEVADGIKVAVCGYARIIKRGGSPEFYCIARIAAPASALAKHLDDQTRLFGDPESIPPVDGIFDKDRFADTLSSAAHALKVAMIDSMSLSASAMLTSIADVMCDDDAAENIGKRLGIGD